MVVLEIISIKYQGTSYLFLAYWDLSVSEILYSLERSPGAEVLIYFPSKELLDLLLSPLLWSCSLSCSCCLPFFLSEYTVVSYCKVISTHYLFPFLSFLFLSSLVLLGIRWLIYALSNPQDFLQCVRVYPCTLSCWTKAHDYQPINSFYSHSTTLTDLISPSSATFLIFLL
jgi:hypothetical protein